MDEATPPNSKEGTAGMPPEVASLIDIGIKKFTRESIHAVYANNTRFESSVWDLRLLFGQYRQGEIDWHTSVTLPWQQAKLMMYYLRLNIAFYESSGGPLEVPPTMKPSQPTFPTDEELQTDPGSMKLYEAYNKVYIDMFGQD
jgi:hypothetical protein